MNLLISLITCFFSLTSPQEEVKSRDWGKLLEIKKTVNAISTDRLGNLYLIDDNHIWLYNNKGDSIGAFNSRKYGQISYVDTSDPYQILVYFQDYSLILFLDNYLSENGDPIDLQELGFDRVTIACQSREKGFWIFDQLRQKVFHLDDNFKVTHETVNLSQWFNKAIEAKSILEYNNKLFLSDDAGVYIFDHFGTYLSKHPLKNADQMQFLDQRILYTDSTKLCEYHLNSFQTHCDNLPAKDIINARMEKDRLYILQKKSVSIFRLK